MPSSTGSNITPNNMAFLNEYLKNLNNERLAVKNTRVSKLLQEASKPKNTRNVINAIAMREMFKEPKGYFKRRAPTRKTYGPRKPRSNKDQKRWKRPTEKLVKEMNNGILNAIAMREMFKEPTGYFKRKPRSNKGKKRGPRTHKLANANWGNNNNNLNKGSVLNGLSKRTF
jgi:hypothetical protein